MFTLDVKQQHNNNNNILHCPTGGRKGNSTSFHGGYPKRHLSGENELLSFYDSIYAHKTIFITRRECQDLRLKVFYHCQNYGAFKQLGCI